MVELIRKITGINWAQASRDDLKNFFLYYTGKDLSLQDLADGAIYCQLLYVTYPGIVDQPRIQLMPTCQAERALNWTLLKMALTKLKAPFCRSIIPMERSRKYGNDDGFEFCKQFVEYYQLKYGQKITNRIFTQGTAELSPYYRVPRVVDDYGISLITKSIRQPNDGNFYIYYTIEEFKALDKVTKTTGKKILKLFGVQDGSAVTEEMIVKYRAGREEKTKETGGHEESDSVSMWEYNQRCLPIEFVDLSLETFLINSKENSICFLPTDILIMICKNLRVLDFVNLSLTCHYLHWRMFAFCKCYAPHTVSLKIKEEEIEEHLEYDHQLMNFYTQYNGLFGFFVSQPAKLPKPFMFKCLEVNLCLPFYNERHFEKCLPLINAIRHCADKCVILLADIRVDGGISYVETNTFFKDINATSFRGDNGRIFDLPDFETQIYNLCPLAQQMEDVLVGFDRDLDGFPPDYFQNSSGFFSNPPHASVMRTLQLIESGQLSPDFQYYAYGECWLCNEEDPNEILPHLFDQYVFKEYFSSRVGNIWTTTIKVEQTGRKYKMRILRCVSNTDGWLCTCIAIGDERHFNYWNCRYEYLCADAFGWRRETESWEMETAVEADEWLPDSDDESTWTETTEDSDEAEESDEETTSGESTAENVDGESEEFQQAVAPVGVPPAIPRPMQPRPAGAIQPARAAAAARLHAGLSAYPSRRHP